MSNLTVYMTSVSSSQEIKAKQRKIIMTLEAKNYEFETKDISSSTDLKDEMREIANNPTALPPQISSGKDYCGDYEGFMNAIEEENLATFLKLQ